MMKIAAAVSWARMIRLNLSCLRSRRLFASSRHRFPVNLLRSRRQALLVGIRPDQASIDREAVTAYKPGLHAALYSRFEQLPQEVAVAEAAVAVLGKGRVIRNGPFQAEPAEPPVGEVQVHLLAQPALGADAEAVTDDEHADHQLRVDRGPPHLDLPGESGEPVCRFYAAASKTQGLWKPSEECRRIGL